MSTLGISAWLGWTEWMVVAIQTTKGKSWQMRTHTQPGEGKQMPPTAGKDNKTTTNGSAHTHGVKS